jgi:hypothetical protein
MNFRNTWAVHTVRTILALLLIAMGASGLYFVLSGNVPEVPGATPAIKIAEEGLYVSGIIIAAKIVEIIAGVLLLVNFRPAFANLLLAPVTVGIMVYDLVLWRHVPASLVPAWFVLFANIYLGYVYWDKYKQLFTK